MPPGIDPNLANAISTVNQFIDIAGQDRILKTRDDGIVSTRNSIWNRIVSIFRPNTTQRINQRTAQTFKDKLLTVAQAFEYSKGHEGYHSKDIFYHFAGFETSQRKQAIESVLDSGILNEELAGNTPLTGRKVQEVLAQIDARGLEFATNKRLDLFTKIEGGLASYRESREAFKEAFFDPTKLNPDEETDFHFAEQNLRTAGNQIESVIDNIRQDLETANEAEDVELSIHLFRELKRAQALKSETDLFNAEKRVYRLIDEKVNPLVAQFEAAIPHIEAIQFNFANLTEEQIKARDDLIALVEQLNLPLERLGNSVRTANIHIANGSEYNSEQLKQWQDFLADVQSKIDDVNSAKFRASQAAIIKTSSKNGAIKSINVRSEETHIVPTDIVTKEELNAIEEEILRLETKIAEKSKNPGISEPPLQSALKKRVSSEAITQIREGKKKVSFSNKLTIARGEFEGAQEIRKSVPKNKDDDEDLSELNEPDDEFGVFDPATNSIQRMTFSDSVKTSRLSNIAVNPAKVAAANQALQASKDELARATRTAGGVVGSFATDLSIIDIDLDLSATPRKSFDAWLLNKVKTANLESLWNVLPTLFRNGHASRATAIEKAVKEELASRALKANQESRGLSEGDHQSLAATVALNANSRAPSESNDPYALISFDRLIVRIGENVSRVDSGFTRDDFR